MIPAPVGNQCPICAGGMREGPLGQTAYRMREKIDQTPGLRLLKAKQLTQVIIGINVIVFVLMLATGSPQGQGTLVRFGAITRPLPENEWWRLLTAMFVHIGILHLLFNMFALLSFGPAIEGRYGKLRFLSLYLGSGLLASAASLLFNDGIGVGAGASGAVFGIFGAWLAFFIKHRDLPGARDQLRSLLFLIGINVVFGVAGNSLGGGIDNFAHFGGLVGGFALGSLLEASVRMRGRTPALAAAAGFLAVVALSAVLVMPRTCTPGEGADVGIGQPVPCTLLKDSLDF